jgi:flagellar hook-basal body complex protein FliE
MSSIDINSVLSQIRSLNQQVGVRPSITPPLLTGEAIGTAAAKPAEGFGSMIQSGIKQVAAAQSESGRLQQAFELGDPNTDLATVMVASAKAQVSFRAMVEVRNRVVSAYQDVMNMPL